MSVIENYNEILNSVKEVSKQANHHVDILAVSKTQCVEKMTELALNNVKMFGESKVQEAVPKIEYLSSKYNDLEFHFIGKVQTNKLKKIVEYCGSAKEAYGLSERQLRNIRGIGEKDAENILESKRRFDLEGEPEILEEREISMITIEFE